MDAITRTLRREETGMRFLYGFVALFLWAILCIAIFEENLSAISAEMQLLTAAIVVAGAMAGGD